MPELPEVQVVVDTLRKIILDKLIKKVFVRTDKILKNIEPRKFEKKFLGKKVISISRKHKWIILEFKDDLMLIHLRMTGAFHYASISKETHEKAHIIFYFENDHLSYLDTRKFSTIYVFPKRSFNDKTFFKNYYYDPFDIEYSNFKIKLLKNRSSIKSALLNQKIITGIGNIYADEILFMSRISPLSQSNKLRPKIIKLILKNAKLILKDAINHGGSTKITFNIINDIKGTYQDKFMVHTREGENCFICGNEIIKIKIIGRGTYYCKKCQKKY